MLVRLVAIHVATLLKWVRSRMSCGILFLARNTVRCRELTPFLEQSVGLEGDLFMSRSGQGLDGCLDVGVGDLVLGDARQVVEDIENLQDDIGVVFVRVECRFENLVAVHPHHSMAKLLVFCGLKAGKQLDSNPLLLALHQSGHDLVDAIFIKGFRLEAVDIVFVVFGDLLPARLLGNGGVPAVATVLDTEGLNRGKRQFGRTLCLRLAADEADAVLLTAVTWLGVGAVAVDIVVEHELLTGADGAAGKNAHAQLLAHHPLVDITVGIARMVAEPAQVALLSGIDKLALGERHEVKVLDALAVVLDHPVPERRLIDDLANVLENEVVWLQVPVRPQAEPLLVGLDDRNIGILLALKPLVLTTRPAVAVSIYALNFGRAVDAVGILATSVVFIISCEQKKN